MKFRTSTLALVLLAGLVGPAAARSHAPAVAKKSAWAHFRDQVRKIGVVTQVEVEYGVPGAGVGIGQGFVVTPRDEARGKRTVGTYTIVGGALGLWGKHWYLSPTERFRGKEVTVGPVNHGSPVFGDRVQVPIIFGYVFIGASRKGGLGLTIAPLHLPFMTHGLLAFPLLRGSVSLYVTHPLLARPASWILDKNDSLMAWLKRTWGKTKAGFARMKLLLKERWQDPRNDQPDAV